MMRSTGRTPSSPQAGSRRGPWRRLFAVVLALAAAQTSAPRARADDNFGFDIVEEKVTDTDKQRIDDARDLLGQERFGEALTAFEAILSDDKLKKFHEQTQYDIGKAFYKMGAYHAALKSFEEILRAGPKHAFFKNSREWLFFIARKVKDDLAALELIARYAKAEDIPPEYQSELSYSLGRYYFLKALELGAQGVSVDPDDQPSPTPDVPGEDTGGSDSTDGKSDDTKGDGKGGFDFSDDSLGGGDGDFPLIARADDDFGFDFGDTKKAEKKPKKLLPRKPKVDKGQKGDAKTDAKSDTKAPDAATPPAAGETAEPAPKSLGKHAFAGPKTSDEALKLALENLKRVKPDFASYGQGIYIQGLVHYARGEFEPAVNAFREVVRMTNPRGGTAANPKLREMAFFSLARIHYQFQQFRYAIFYYDRIDRDSEQWLPALFESSWAHFRLGEYEKALGNLVTLQSPFFQDEYYPESSILKAITFYENCRYSEARAFLGEFTQSYGGVLAELDRLVGDSTETAGAGKAAAKTSEQLFDELTALEAKVAAGKDDASRSYALTARLLRLGLSDKRVKGYREAIAEVDDEKAKLQSLPSPFVSGAVNTDRLAAIDARRAELVGLAGTFLREKLTGERLFLKDLNGKLLRIRFEITKMEKEGLEAKMQDQNQTVQSIAYDFTAATDDERLYWPFEGEYWRDELGTYQYTLTRGCRPPSETTITGE